MAGNSAVLPPLTGAGERLIPIPEGIGKLEVDIKESGAFTYLKVGFKESRL